MSAVFNSSNSFIAELTRINKNAIEILNTLALTASTSSESVAVQLTLENSQVSTLTIPSLGYINNELKRLNNNINQLAGIGQTDVLVRQEDGSYQKVIAVNLNPAPRRIDSLTVPVDFVPKDNYFFNNLVSPQMVVRFDLTGKIDTSVKKVVVRRLILDIDSVDKQTIFNNTFKNKSNLSFDDTIIFLTDSIINFNIDDETIDLPLSTPRYYGNFTVTQILEQVDGQTGVRRYTFASLSYTDSTSRVKSNQTLKPGDVLVKGASTFAVQEIDQTTNTVTLKRLQGEDVIAIGVDELAIQSELYSPQIASVPVTVDEYQIIFVKPVFDNILSSEWSPGVGFYSSDLFYQTPAGNVGITEFYNTRVVDLSEDLLAQAREKRISILTGTKPSPPQIQVQNFVVQRLNDQLEGIKSEQEINQIYNQIQINDRTISSLTTEINKINSILSSNANLSNSQVQSYESSKKNLQTQVDSLNEQNSGLLTKAQNFLNQNPNLSTSKAKYSVFGFWQIPAAVISANGKKEEVVAFRVRYRYLPVNDSVASAREIPFTTDGGTSTSAYFSRYEEFVTKPRTKTVLADGNVVWTQSDIQNPNEVNTQQLNLSITQGERLEIQVASISEAGWPANPLESDFSSGIIVDFPDSLVSPDLENLVNSIQTRLAQQGIQDTITNIGVTQHLQQVQQVGSSYLAHSGDSIYYSLSGSSLVTINQKIKELEDKITALQTKIESAKGTLRVRIKDPFGNITNVSNGSVIKVNSGFYTEDIKAVPSSERIGAIITKRYDVIIDNTSATPLQLISQFPGLLTDLLPSAPGTTFKGIQVPSDYAQKQYNIVPIGLATAPSRGKANFYSTDNIAMQPVPFQSRQQASQFLYVRNVSINGSNRYFTEATANPSTPVNSGAANAKIWNQTFDTKNTSTINGITYLKPLGGGGLSSFCVSVDHPAVKFVKVGTAATEPSLTNLPTLSNYFNSKDLNNANVSNLASNAPFRYPQFYHASTVSGAPSKDAPAQQARYFQFSNTGDWPYPMKQAFYQNDRYLIGTGTVGSYLFVESPSMETIKVKGTGLDSFSELDFGSENQIIVPVIYQYRMVDYIENVGGAPNSLITNITYTRGLGLDISIKGEPTFSFDFIATASYTAETVTQYTTTTLTSSSS
jgi:hypothetical protein